MDLISIVLIAIGLAMDAFAVSVSCGLCTFYKRYMIALKAAFMFGFFNGECCLWAGWQGLLSGRILNLWIIG